jgi:hypothetical protein
MRGLVSSSVSETGHYQKCQRGNDVEETAEGIHCANRGSMFDNHGVGVFRAIRITLGVRRS